MARRKIVAGNWKMNMTPSQAVTPIMVIASVSASAFATAIVPLARIGFSNTPIGPFHTTVLADFTASAERY